MPQSLLCESLKNVRDFSIVDDEDKHDSRSAGELELNSDRPALIAQHSLQPVLTDGKSFFSMHAAYKIEPCFTFI